MITGLLALMVLCPLWHHPSSGLRETPPPGIHRTLQAEGENRGRFSVERESLGNHTRSWCTISRTVLFPAVRWNSPCAAATEQLESWEELMSKDIEIKVPLQLSTPINPPSLDWKNSHQTPKINAAARTSPSLAERAVAWRDDSLDARLGKQQSI